MKTALGWIGQVVAWLVILVTVAVLAVAVLIPRLAGATPYTILTGSMAPGMPPGTLVVVKPVDPDSISIGDVITYQLKSDQPTVVTHRVISIGFNAEGESRFTTQGDANSVADATPVRPVQIRGVKWYSVPYLGHVNSALSGSQRQFAVYVVAALLLAYAGFQLVGALLGRSRRSPVHTSAIDGQDEELT